MKNFSPKMIVILAYLLFSCHSKPEKKPEPIVNNNYNTIQNYKFDDDEIINRKHNDSILSKKSKTDVIKKNIK